MHDIATSNGHLQGNLAGGSGSKTVVADGALPLNYDTIIIDSTAGALALTLADGAPKQVLNIVMEVDGGDAVVTYNGASTATFADVNDALELRFNGSTSDWEVKVNNGSVALA